MAERVRSFAPVASADARVLILGSMPGVASLNAGQYYAHPQNRFWPIMGRLLGFDPANTSYAQRTAYLTAAGVALWDVLQSCERSGSLDSAIRRETQRVNDFSAFFAAHPKMRAVYFNGAHAAQVFARVVLLTALIYSLCVCLPRARRMPAAPLKTSWLNGGKFWRPIVALC